MLSHRLWLPFYRPRSAAQLRLVCFPHAGGGASQFLAWRAHLPAEVELCAVQLPGRETRLGEPPATELAPLVAALADLVASLGKRPFALFGHSLGALLAFETARELARRGASAPLRLFASAHRAPHLPRREPAIHHLAEEAFLAELQHLDGTPAAVLADPELRRLVLPALRADFRLAETHRWVPGPPLACAVTALGGSTDGTVDRQELTAWGEHCEDLHLRLFPGGHFFHQEHPRAVAAAIAEDLRTTAGLAQEARV